MACKEKFAIKDNQIQNCVHFNPRSHNVLKNENKSNLWEEKRTCVHGNDKEQSKSTIKKKRLKVWKKR